jgi:hypothetical protein
MVRIKVDTSYAVFKMVVNTFLGLVPTGQARSVFTVDGAVAEYIVWFDYGAKEPVAITLFNLVSRDFASPSDAQTQLQTDFPTATILLLPQADDVTLV